MENLNTHPDVPDGSGLLCLIAGEGLVTFQTFDESSQQQRKLTKVLHGRFSQHASQLTALNSQGAGVFFMVNGGDGLGRRATNVMEVRALFVDLDGAPLEPVMQGPLKPHSTVETSPGRYHAYWCVEGVALSNFTALQSNIASRFDGDPKVKDLPRVMRLPGFLHQKGEPHLSRILTCESFRRYSRDDVADAFGLELQQPKARAPECNRLEEEIPEGHRNDTLFNLARGLVNKGHTHEQVSTRIQLINAQRCRPPVCATEVDTLVASAVRHGAKGSLNLPLSVFDSPEYRGLSHQARTVAAVAYRRFNGQNNGNIALPFSEFEMEFSRKQTFYRARAELVKSGIVRRTRKRRYHERGGMEPDLFAVRDGND